MSMPPPPPPAPGPGPPPPPMMNMKSTTAGSGDGRGMLLDSIRQGTKLKKTTTVDKSAPLIGKVPTGGGSTNSPKGAMNSPRQAPAQGNLGANGLPLAGLFAGGMPKLRPTGQRTGASGNSSPESQSSSNRSSPEQQRPTGNHGNQAGKAASKPFAKQQNNINHAKRQLSNDVTKRGPPPQPPAPKSPLPSSTSDSVLTDLQPSRNITGSTSALPTQHNRNNSAVNLNSTNNTTTNKSPDNVPNQSSLFGNKSNFHASLSSLHHSNQLSTDDSKNLGQSLININQNTTQSKPVINHGKPNLAPKPPVLNSRPNVSRAQSMRVPRSPPVAPPGAPPFPPMGGTLRGAPAGLTFHQSQDCIKASKPAPPVPSIGLNGRPSIPPPIRPPANRPPPPPSRSTNITAIQQNISSSIGNLPTATIVANRSSPNLNNLNAPSSNTMTRTNLNLSTNNVNSTGMTVPPPPPPHRSIPAPPPPISNRQPMPIPLQVPGPPAPPVRNSSMRNSNGTGSMLAELESRFTDMFHRVHEFPLPDPFVRVSKEYNSTSYTNSITKQQLFTMGKQQAPLPPSKMQLGRSYAGSSNC